MSKIKNVATITDDKVINVRRAAIEHRGRWAAGFYTEARAQGIDLEPIMRKVIFQQGVDSGKAEAKKFDEVTPKTYGHYSLYSDRYNYFAIDKAPLFDNAYPANKSNSRYNPYVDVNNDGCINSKDYVLINILV